MITAFLPTLIALLIRHALTAVGVYLVGAGVVEPTALDSLIACADGAVEASNDTVQVIIGGIAATAGLIWSGKEKLARASP